MLAIKDADAGVLWCVVVDKVIANANVHYSTQGMLCSDPAGNS